MKIKNSAAIFFSALALILFSSSSIATLGVSPATLTFDKMLRGGYAQRSMLISTLSDAMNVDVLAEGNIASWITLSNQTMNISMNTPQRVAVIIQSPFDIANGNYSGSLLVIRRPLETPEIPGTGNIVLMSVRIPINVEITDVEVRDCTANSFSIASTEENVPTKFNVFIRNNGNVRIKPRITLDIWDQDRLNIVKFLEFDSDEILPTIEKETEREVSVDELPIGQYWVDASVPECKSSDLLTFDVMKQGSMTVRGKLIQIRNNPWLNLGDTAKITAIFKNDGEKEVNARFKGYVSLEGQIVKVLESDTINVPPGKIVELDTFFKPEQVGRYTISGKVYYEKKVSYESSSVLNVIVGKEKGKTSIFTIIYIIIIITTLFLLFAIFRRRRKHKHKFRQGF